MDLGETMLILGRDLQYKKQCEASSTWATMTDLASQTWQRSYNHWEANYKTFQIYAVHSLLPIHIP